MNISIDIGTSYSCSFMHLPNGDIAAVKIGTGPGSFGSDVSMPSAVYLNKNEKLILGQAAMNSRMENPGNFYSEFKRILGQNTTVTLGSKTYQPEDFYAHFFRHIRDRLEKHISGEALDCCYLTCPVNFNEKQRDLILVAAKGAGFFNVKLIEEPIAAVQGCRSWLSVKEGAVILVYDFGGGTFDAALVEYKEGGFRALTDSSGISNCGGSDIDRKIYQDILAKTPSELLEAVKANKTAYARFAAQLMEMAVKAKHCLSDYELFEDKLLMGRYELSYSLTRNHLEGMISGMVADTVACCRNLLQEAGLHAEDLSQVLLVGGSSRIPLVTRAVKELVGAVPVRLIDDPEMAVARGALFHNASQSAWQMFRQGQTYEEQKMLDIALGCYRQSAKAGIAQAQYALAKWYQTGIDGVINPDPIQAEDWYHKAALQDHTDAMYRLAEIYRTGKTQPEEVWLGWYQKAAQKGHAEAQCQLGNHYRLRDKQTAGNWYIKAAEQGHAEAQFKLGYYCSDDEEKRIYWITKAAEQRYASKYTDSRWDLGIIYHDREQYADAVKWLLPLAQEGDHRACEIIGWYSEQGIVLEKSREMAKKWYLCAAEGENDPGRITESVRYRLGALYEEEGDYLAAAEWYGKVSWRYNKAEELAQCALAQLYIRGKVPGKSFRDGKKLLKKLVNRPLIGEEPFPEAAYQLGLCYEDGVGCSIDYKAAKDLYEIAAIYQHRAGQYKYACMLLGEMQKADDIQHLRERAIWYLQKSAKQGYIPALNRYGKILMEDDEWDKAAECLRQSAEQGDPEGTYFLALCHNRRSDDNPQDREKTAQLYLQSAQRGYAMAQYVVAKEYGHQYPRKEYLYPRDNQKYRYWCCKAAAQGHLEAQKELYSIYTEGMITEKNAEEAERWLRMAAEQGDVLSQMTLAKLLVHENFQESLLWYEKAAQQGYTDASLYLADYYFDNQQYEKAIVWYKQALSIRASFRVGEIYDNGWGTAKNPKEASFWYCDAHYRYAITENKDKEIAAEAAFRVAGYYEAIKFPFQKKKQAEEWYYKAADLGHVGARLWIAKQMEMRKDDLRAKEWYMKAAAGKNAEGLWQLAEYLSRKQHTAQAYDIYKKAAEAGHEGAKQWLEAKSKSQ